MSAAAAHRWFGLDAYVTAHAFTPAGLLAFANGDGAVTIIGDDGERTSQAHRGAALHLCAHPAGGFVSAGDDGRVCRIAADGAVTLLHEEKGRSIDALAAHHGSGAIAFSSGKNLFILPKGENTPRRFQDAATVTGLAFDPKGKRIAASRYGGVSLWWVNPKEQTPQDYAWKGSHIAVWWHPGGDYVITSMQENALHGWRLSDKAHMRMAGYPAKVHAASWLAGGRWLLTSGAEGVICWPFDGKGPMGKSASEVGPGGVGCTAVAGHPTREILASGYADGGLWLTRFADDKTTCVRPPGAGPVSVLGWSPDGVKLAFGTEDGAAGLLDFSAALSD